MKIMTLSHLLCLLLAPMFLLSCRQDVVSEQAVQEEIVTEQVEQKEIMSEQAILAVRFFESAPKDSFVFENRGPCLMQDFTVLIDLNETAGKLIFDTTSKGAGVEVFQPFEAGSGQIKLVSSDAVKDGDSELMVDVSGLASGESVGFTIDVDDTLPEGELGMIRVTEGEMSGAAVYILVDEQEVAKGVFDNASQMMLGFPCVIE